MWTGVYWTKSYWTGYYWTPTLAVIVAVAKQKIRGFTKNVGRLMNP